MQALKCLSSIHVKSEHYHVRNHVGVFDVSHMGEIVISGPESELFLENCTTNDIIN